MGAVALHGDASQTLSTVTSADDLEYRLTSAMEKLQNKVSALLNLRDKVSVTLYLSSSLETIAPYVGLKGLSDLPGQVQTMVQELNARNYGKLAFRHVDPGKPDAPEIPEEYHLQELQWPELPEAGIQAGSGRIGLVLRHDGESRTVALLDISSVPLMGTRYELIREQALQEAVNQNLYSLLDINQTLGYLAGHGTPPVGRFARTQQRAGRSLANFEDLVGKNYTLKQVRLKNGIPDGLSCLVIAGPREEFTDYELFQIDQALMRGTNLAVFTDSFKRQRQQRRARMRRPSYVPNQTGLQELLRHYGLKVGRSIVLDEHCYKQQLSQRQGGGEQPIYFAPLIKNENINHEPSFMRNITRLVAVQASPLHPAGNSTGNGTVRSMRLFSSSERSWTMSERITLNPSAIRPPSTSKMQGRQPLAYLLSGRFSSYFADRGVPERKASETNATQEGNATAAPEKGAELQQRIKGPQKMITKGNAAQVFAIGSSHMITDTVLASEGTSPNSVFVMNVLDKLNGREAMAQLRSKVQRFQPLGEVSNAARTGIKAFALIGLPLLVGLFGLGIWAGRQKRKQRIRAMFE
jgi:hypothetical protein